MSLLEIQNKFVEQTNTLKMLGIEPSRVFISLNIEEQLKSYYAWRESKEAPSINEYMGLPYFRVIEKDIIQVV